MGQNHRKFQQQLRAGTAATLPRGPEGRFQPLQQSRPADPAPPAPPPPEIPEIRPETPAQPAPEIPASPAPAGPAAPDPSSELAGSTGPAGISGGAEQLAEAIAQIPVQDPPGAPAGLEPGQKPPAPPLTPDEFWGVFNFVHDGAAGGGQMLTGNPGWKYVSIQPREQEAARKASDALYGLAKAYPKALGWLIQPQNEIMAAVIVIGSYGYGKYQGVSRALAHHAALKAAPAEVRPLGTPQDPSS